MPRDGANYASPCRLDRLRATKMARLGTPYCGALRGIAGTKCVPVSGLLLPAYARACHVLIYVTIRQRADDETTPQCSYVVAGIEHAFCVPRHKPTRKSSVL